MPRSDNTIFFFVFRDGHRICKFSPCFGQETGHTPSLSLTDYHSHPCMLFWEEGQEIANHDYRRNVKEDVVGVVRLDENYYFFYFFLNWHIAMTHRCSSIRSQHKA